MAKTIEVSMFYNASPQIFEFAKQLRTNMTVAEDLLWNKLSNSAFGVRFRKQHPISKFIADFYCHKYKLVIEIDGEIHNKQKEYDVGRTAELEKWDIRVIRFTNDEVLSDIENVIDRIKAALISPKSPKGDF